MGVFASAHLTREGELLVWVLFILVRFFLVLSCSLLFYYYYYYYYYSTIIIIIISDIIIIIDVVVFNLWHLVSVRPVSN